MYALCEQLQEYKGSEEARDNRSDVTYVDKFKSADLKTFHKLFLNGIVIKSLCTDF